MKIEIPDPFEEVLEPFGAEAANFFLAAGLYHARKISFAKAAELAGLSFDDFKFRLKEHFGTGFILSEETVLEDMENATYLAGLM